MHRFDVELHVRLKNLISSMGYEMLGYELSQGRHAFLRLYIDSPNGVSIDDCSKVSHQVSAFLDVEDPIQGGYRLEISSPGIDRPLFELEQYHRFIGKKVRLKLHTIYNDHKQFKGTLIKVEGANVHLLVEDTSAEIVIPFANIKKANLIGEV